MASFLPLDGRSEDPILLASPSNSFQSPTMDQFGGEVSSPAAESTLASWKDTYPLWKAPTTYCFARYNKLDSMEWNIRHYHGFINGAPFTHTNVSGTELGVAKQLHRRRGKGKKTINLSRACAYCFRMERGVRKGSTTVDYCGSCQQFLCSSSYGEDKNKMPLPSCHELWHCTGEMERPELKGGTHRVTLLRDFKQRSRRAAELSRHQQLLDITSSVCANTPQLTLKSPSV